MGEFLRAAFAGLPTVTTHPLTLVGYVVAVLAWLIIAWRVKRNKNLLQNLDKLPESERIDALKVEMGHVPIKEGLSPEQYLRSRIHSFYFLGFVILCVLIATVFIVSAVIGREKEGAANVEVGLYDQDSVASVKGDESGAKFVKDSNRQSAPVVVENDEPPRNKDIYEQNILKYTYDRVDGKKIQITPEMPYLSLLRQEGPITDLPSCRITFPRLSIKVVNNTNRTLVISEVAINIRSSTVITLPILSVSGSDSLPARELYFNNEGWGDLLSPTVEYNLADMDSCEKVDFADTKYTSHLPTIVSSTHLDISQAIMDFKSPSPSPSENDPLRGSFVCVFGKVNYGTRSGTSRTATFRTSVALVDVSYRMSIPSYTYDLLLDAGKQNYVKRLPVSHELKPGESDLFLLRLAADKWAQFDMDFSFRTTEGKYLPGNEVLLEIFVPRSMARRVDFQEDFQKRVNSLK